MSDTDEWQLLETYETKKFIEDVRDEAFKGLFEGPDYELWTRNLQFLDGYSHYILCNRGMFPPFALHYISNGDNHYYLDGSEHSLELLIGHGALRLTEDNVLDYIQFHSDVTFYPYRKVKFIIDPARSPYSGASAMSHHFKTLKYHEKFELEDHEDDLCFYVRMPLLYNGETMDGRVQVMKHGEINILEPVKIPLMDGKRDHAPLDYDHLREKELLEQNLEVLLQSEEGKRLWETVESYHGQLKFVSGVGSNGLAVAANATGYIVAPENIETYSPYQVITMIGVLREMELMLMGKKRPDPHGELHEVLEHHVAINLDIFLEICIIVEELVSAGYEEVLRKFKESGFADFYSGYKNRMANEEMARIIAKMYNIKVVEE